MSTHDISNSETKDNRNLENVKIRDLKDSLENKNENGNERLSVQEADARVEARLSGTGIVEDKLNKRQDISFGRTSGCAKFCAKVHDGTSVHGTY